MESNVELKWESFGSCPVENRPNFWKAILLSVTKPHLINRRLAGAEQIAVLQSNSFGLNTDGKLIKQIACSIQKQFDEDIDSDFMQKILNEMQLSDRFQEVDIHKLSEYDLNKKEHVVVILSKLLPKNLVSYKCTYEIAILGNVQHLNIQCKFSVLNLFISFTDFVNKQVAYLNLLKNQTTGFIKKFAIQLNDHEDGTSNMNVVAPNDADENFTRQLNWINSIFMPKISKWIISMDEQYADKPKSVFESIESLSLVNLTEYNQLYNDLKVKYGEHMVKVCIFHLFIEVFSTRVLNCSCFT